MPSREIPSENQERHESLPSKERYVFRCKAITITGRPGSGVSTTAEDLAAKLRINLYDVGRVHFRTEEDIEIIDYLERPLRQDRNVDDLQKELLRNANTQNPLLLVSRLAGIITDEIQEEDVVNIFISCPRDTRYHRILERERERGNTNLTLRELGIETRNREESDRNQFKRVHPQIEFIDPFDPNAKGVNKNRIYRFIVSSARNTPNEVGDEIIRRLIEDGAIKP